jgi:hypothetical protein
MTHTKYHAIKHHKTPFAICFITLSAAVIDLYRANDEGHVFRWYTVIVAEMKSGSCVAKETQHVDAKLAESAEFP